MNTRLVLECATAALLFALPSMAATDTWDGGGGNDLITLGANWVDNTAPVSDIASTDLIFAGLNRLTPALNASFSTRSITFNNTAGAFTIGGQTFVVGAAGIVNNDPQTMTFDNTVRFSGVADSTINAASGGLAFNGTVVLPTDTLAVTGGFPTSFTNFSGSSTLNIKDAGTMTWTPGLATSCDVTVNNSTLTMGADGGADLFNSNASIAVNGTSTFNITESLTLDGAQLTRASSGIVNITAGKTLTVQNGGDALITGAFVNNLASTIAVTGAGSTFSTTGHFSVGGGGSLNVAADGDVTSGDPMSIGTSGNGTVTVDGAGSTLAGMSLLLGGNTNSGSLAFTNNSGGTFTTIGLVPTAAGGAIGLLNIQSGADVTCTSLNLSIISGANTGTVTVTGSGSTLAITGAGTALIGSASGNLDSLNVNDSGTFTSGTGGIVVRATGTISVMGGDYHSNGNFTLNGGQVTVDSAGDFNVAPGTVFTVQDGGVANMAGFFATNGSTFAVTGAGSTVSTTLGVGGSLFSVNNGSTATINNGARLQTVSNLGIANGNGNGSLTIDGAGTQLMVSGNLLVSGGSGVGSLTFSNGSTGTAEQLSVDESSINSGTVGTVNIQSGATATAGSLRISRQAGTHTGTLTIDGAGSALTLSGAGITTIGAASGSSGTLNVQNSGTHSTGTGLTTVNATGTIAITGGVYTSNGDLTMNGGQLTRDLSGVFSLAAGRTFTVQNGGDALFTGVYDTTSATTINVTGAGSTFSTTQNLTFGHGSTLNISAGGSVNTGLGFANIGLSGGDATVTVEGIGSSLTASTAAVGANGNSGTLTFSNGSAGTFNNLRLASGSIAGTLSIQSGAAVTANSLNVGASTGPATGTVTISGPGSALAISGAATIGTGSGSSDTVTVVNGGSFVTGSGLTTVNATGALNIIAGGTLTGAADFSGTGPVNIEGSFLPGTASGVNQTTSVSFAQNMTFHPTTGIIMEIGGTAPGTQHDQIVFNGVGSTQVKWDGTLKLVLINGFAPQAGQTFNLFDFDAARDTGAFTTIDVVTNGLMPPGLAFNFDELYTTGVIRVVATGGLTFAQWAATELGVPGAPPLADHNRNGYTNLIEFALGLFPAVPGTVEPNGGLHIYPDGERLRVLFTRPLDRTGITLRIQAASDLTNWTDLAVSIDSAPFTGPGFVSENRAHPLPDPGLVEVRDILTSSTAPRRQIRLLITLTP